MCSLMTTQLLEWANAELVKRDWSAADLARKSGISPTHISKVFSEQRKPGNDFLTGLARAFNYPPEFVYRMAGVLPPATEATNMGEIEHLFVQLPAAKREEYTRLLRFWVEEEKRKSG